MAASNSNLDRMETLFAALADRTRLRLLNLMRYDEVCVCFFTEVLGESQPKISRHLAYLRKSGLVESRRDGKWMHYRIVLPENEMARTVIDDTLKWLGSRDDMQSEHEELISVCCSLDVPVTIAKAPKPESLVERNETPEEVEAEELETYLL